MRLARSVLDDPSRRRAGPLVCVYNRTGGARLLACAHCGELAQCTRVRRPPCAAGRSERLRCPRCGADAARRVRGLRAAAHEDAAGRGEPSARGAGRPPRRRRWARCPAHGRRRGETAPGAAGEPVLIGTEAVLHRVRRAAAVAFLDIDLHLLAPRLQRTDETLALLVRAGAPGRRPAGSGRPRPGSWCRPGSRTTRCSPPSRRGIPSPCSAAEAERCAGAPASRPSPRWPRLGNAGPGLRRGAGRCGGPSTAGHGDDARRRPRFLIQAPEHQRALRPAGAVPRPAGPRPAGRGRPDDPLSRRPLPGWELAPVE